MFFLSRDFILFFCRKRIPTTGTFFWGKKSFTNPSLESSTHTVHQKLRTNEPKNKCLASQFRTSPESKFSFFQVT